MPDGAIGRTDIFGGTPHASWGVGRVTLLGDAAHPMTTVLGQGACMAIEDGVALAQCLRGAGTIEAGLRAYEARRTARTGAIMRLQQRFSSSEARETPVRCWVRNQTIRLLFDRTVRPRYEATLAAGVV